VAELIPANWSLAFFYMWRALFQEAIELFGQAAARLAEENEPAFANPERRLAYAQMQIRLAPFYRAQGKVQQAADLFQQGLATLHQADPDSVMVKKEMGMAHNGLGYLAWLEGHYAQAKQHFSQSLAFLRAIDFQVMAARVTLFSGITAYELGDYVEADRLFQEGLLFFKKLGDYWPAIEALGYAAQVSQLLDKPFIHIREIQEDYLRQSRATGNPWAIAHALMRLGATLNLLGGRDREQARAMLEESVQLCRELNGLTVLAPALYHLGLTSMALGDDPAADKAFREALKVAVTAQFIPLSLQILVELATLLARRLRPSPATQGQLLRLLLLIWRHPASNRQAQDRAAELLAQLEAAGLPSAVVAAAKTQAQGNDRYESGLPSARRSRLPLARSYNPVMSGYEPGVRSSGNGKP
jgi:tetratricopeptide (TPR) repeat protein